MHTTVDMFGKETDTFILFSAAKFGIYWYNSVTI